MQHHLGAGLGHAGLAFDAHDLDARGLELADAKAHLLFRGGRGRVRTGLLDWHQGDPVTDPTSIVQRWIGAQPYALQLSIDHLDPGNAAALVVPAAEQITNGDLHRSVLTCCLCFFQELHK